MLALSGSLASGEPAQLSWVRVGEPGNLPERQTGWGSVGYEFEIGRTEVTNAHYAHFLNSVATKGDPAGLWHRNLAEGPMGGIARVSVDDGAFVYRVRPGFENLPVVHVSWFAAARFCNWLHAGQPNDSSSLEGDASNGSYDTRFFPPQGSWPSDAVKQPAARNVGARYWLPSLDEWVKAGFHRPGSGGLYYRYATGSDVTPNAEPPPGGPNAANFYLRGWAVGYPHLTPVGAYASSTSPWGTFDQAGNVMEWLEDRLAGAPAKRRFAGGAAARFATMLTLDYADWEDADHRLMVVGFRIARTVEMPLPALRTPTVEVAAADVEPVTAMEGAPRSGFEFVRVGNPGNAPDPVFGHGGVAHVFEIGRYELTNADYADFLNAVARKADPFALYERSMGDGFLGGIVREETAEGFVYRPKAGWSNRPATYLSWYRLARLANWLHYGRPDFGTSGPDATEGDHEKGAYDTRNFPKPDDDSVDRARLPSGRNPGARYFLPTEDEWFKAGHHDQARSGPRAYWTYPVRSDTPPDNVRPPGGRHSVNYVADYFCLGMPFVVTEVGSFPEADSAYGTFDQGGNVWEWTESWRVPRSPNDWRADEHTRVLRGGSATYSFIGVSAANADPGHPNHALAVYGGRMARQPQDGPTP